jgi:hypothetical protein
LDQVLQHMKAPGHQHNTHDTELDTMLLDAAQTVETCRVALLDRGTEDPQLEDVSDSQLLTWDLPTMSPSLTPSLTPNELLPNQPTPECSPLFPLSKDEAFELIENFLFEAEYFYPFIPFDSLTSLVDSVIDSSDGPPDFITGTASEDRGDVFDNRSVEMLRLLLASAIVSRLKNETETSARMVSAVAEKLATRSNATPIDAKDIAIATMLVSRSLCTPNGFSYVD